MHGRHSDAAANRSGSRPGPHLLQLSIPSLRCRPNVQSMQKSRRTLGARPGSHTAQRFRVSSAYPPGVASHASQYDRLPFGAVPGSQTSQVLFLPARPGLQDTHDAACWSGPYPSSQRMHVPEPSGAYVPGRQPWHRKVMSSEYRPARHVVQAVAPSKLFGTLPGVQRAQGWPFGLCLP
jgi:hypothetical protein